jgi:hypothetical protein
MDDVDPKDLVNSTTLDITWMHRVEAPNTQGVSFITNIQSYYHTIILSYSLNSPFRQEELLNLENFNLLHFIKHKGVAQSPSSCFQSHLIQTPWHR